MTVKTPKVTQYCPKVTENDPESLQNGANTMPKRPKITLNLAQTVKKCQQKPDRRKQLKGMCIFIKVHKDIENQK